MKIDYELRPEQVARRLDRLWELSAGKIRSIDRDYDHKQGSPVFTAAGTYTTRGWTEWTSPTYGSASG